MTVGEPNDTVIDAPYLAAVERLAPDLLRAILRRLGEDLGRRTTGLALVLNQRLASRQSDPFLPAALGPDAEAVASLIALTERTTWKIGELLAVLTRLGVDGNRGLDPLIDHGWLVPTEPIGVVIDSGSEPSTRRLYSGALEGHSRLLEAPRSTVGGLPLGSYEGRVAQVRETDGLEGVLRLAVVWQRVSTGPLRRTQGGQLFKRDRERLLGDAALSGPVADALRPLDPEDLVSLWLELAEEVGLLSGVGETLRAADASFWSEHAVHLPQMIATRWLTAKSDTSAIDLRIAGLLRLADAPAGDWIPIESLAKGLAEAATARGRAVEREAVEKAVLGLAYILGLTRTAEVVPSGGQLVQLTDRGRYVMGRGGPPSPPERPDRFLFVQPNYEIIAYRQGLNPPLIGRLSRLAEWNQVGSALGLTLTRESIHLGLDGGLEAAKIREWMDEHAVRPIPDAVTHAIETWAARRSRLTYYAAATLIEFPDETARQAALERWPTEAGAAPLLIGERLVLIESESKIPFERFRLGGARDYRRPAECCVEVQANGTTLSVDPTRGDLFIEAELARFSERMAVSSSRGSGAEGPRRLYQVTPNSIRRGAEEGLSLAGLTRWFEQRAMSSIPPAVRLLWHGLAEPSERRPLEAVRRWVLNVASADLMEGLLQHPQTREAFDDRLGPTSASIRAERLEDLRASLGAFGIELRLDRD